MLPRPWEHLGETTREPVIKFDNLIFRILFIPLQLKATSWLSSCLTSIKPLTQQPVRPPSVTGLGTISHPVSHKRTWLLQRLMLGLILSFPGNPFPGQGQQGLPSGLNRITFVIPHTTCSSAGLVTHGLRAGSPLAFTVSLPCVRTLLPALITNKFTALLYH